MWVASTEYHVLQLFVDGRKHRKYEIKNIQIWWFIDVTKSTHIHAHCLHDKIFLCQSNLYQQPTTNCLAEKLHEVYLAELNDQKAVVLYMNCIHIPCKCYLLIFYVSTLVFVSTFFFWLST